ncbi:MAG TPA: hypothetical protein VKS23_05010 [Thermoanaerobaculia bacterium]|nr:hypothetical protein [Thermoanaerobaculia bacterium]
MAPSAKRGPASQGKRRVRSSPKSHGPAKPFLRFYIPADLSKKTLSVLDRLEKAPDATLHRDALADAVVELTNGGMDYYFLKPLKVARVGFIVQQTADLGLAGALRVMGSVIRNIIGRMDEPQLLSVCGSIRQFMA